jgi:signal transduction histidine kinase
MIKSLRFKTSWLYHPVTVFLSIQVVWILLIVFWIRWYLEKHAQMREMAERLRSQAEVETGWFPLVEGGVLLALILAGATVIFIFWSKQHRLNYMQRAFVSNVTHELKSPVASIQLALETMAMRDLPDDRKREFIGMMLDDTERLTVLINRILGAARIEKRSSRYNPKPVSMRRFVEDVIDEDRHLFEKDGHVVSLDPKGGDARVAMDTGAMHVALSNLIENAARYSPKGSSIRIRLHRDIRSCRLDVVDAGDGIRREDLKNIFKMFWRGEQNQRSRTRGTGLGLYIVRNIVRDHGGKIWAMSAGPGRGSTFSVRLPRLTRYWSGPRSGRPRVQSEGQA